MTQFGQDNDSFLSCHYAMKRAYLSAFTAQSAQGFVYRGDRYGNRCFMLKTRVQENMAVGFFNVAIEKLDLIPRVGIGVFSRVAAISLAFLHVAF